MTHLVPIGPSRRLRLLDLFCCAGGAAVGYARAGFAVDGCDIAHRPNYPFPARIRKDLTLCGEMFSLGVIRHRNFELGGWMAPQPAHRPHRGRVRGWRHGRFYDGPYVAAYGNGGGKPTIPELQAAMGITWTDVREELTEAIPPAYTEHIGRAYLTVLGTAGPGVAA